MSEERWRHEPPPQEAYLRVTNPERFAPLHDFAVNVLAEMEATFHAERAEGYDLDPELEKPRLARPSVKLMPRADQAAPIVVSFTTFPAARVRAGLWHTESIPPCGYDACDETVESAIRHLAWLVENVVAGHFRETMKVPYIMGDAWQHTEIGSSGLGRQESRRARVVRVRARKMLANHRSKYEWQPWPRR